MGDKKLVDLYPYRLMSGMPEFLMLKRASGKIYEGQWRMVGGKVQKGETSWQAALRELDEETSLPVVKAWTVPSLNHFYEAKTDSILLIPAFAAEVPPFAEPELDDEHTTFQWMRYDECKKAIVWPEQKRLLGIIEQLVISNQIADEWIIPKNF